MKKILVLCCLAVAIFSGVLSVGSNSAEAASNSFKNMHQETYVDEKGQEWLRLVFDMEKEEVEYSVKENPDRFRQFIITLKDVNIGKLKSDYNFDGKLARYITLRKGTEKSDKKDLYVTVVVGKSLSEQGYNVYTIPKDKKLKRPTQLVVEISSVPAEKIDTGEGAPGTVPGVAGHTIVIDPGHGGSDSGARSAKNLYEKDVTFAVSTKAQKILEASGANIIMTRTSDVDVYGPYASATKELQARCNYVTRKTDIFVCIHANAATSTQAKGTETYYCDGSWMGRLLATNIQSEIIEATGLLDRGIKTANFYVLLHTPVPANLIELGFLTNSEEAAKLGDDEFQDKLAMAICKGISGYFTTLRENSRR